MMGSIWHYLKEQTNFMKKKLLLLIFTGCLSFGQIPSGYYNTATGSGYVLKTNLKKIINDISDGIPSEHLHIDQGYTALWTLYTQTSFRDNYYENDGSLLDIYSEKPTSIDSYNFTSTSQQCGTYSTEGDCYNREHLVAQCFFDNFQIDPMRNDAFHVVPSDGKVNADRGNLPFGKVNSVNYTSSNGSKRGTNTIDGYSSFSGTVFDPINEFKGDVARAFLYFVTRYEDSMDDFYNAANGSTCQCKNMFDGTINQAISNDFILRLIKWHQDDPVSSKEIAQNNTIYNHQNNRNPFIDHPEYVCQIWTTQCATVTSLFTDIFVENEIDIFTYIQDDVLKITTPTSLDKIEVYNLNGQLISNIGNTTENTISISNLSKGIYLLKIYKNNHVLNKKCIVY